MASSPSVRAASCVAPILIPTIAQEAASQQYRDTNMNTNMNLQDSQDTLKYPPDRIVPMAGDIPLHSDTLIPPHDDHSQWVESTSEPASLPLKGTAKK